MPQEEAVPAAADASDASSDGLPPCPSPATTSIHRLTDAECGYSYIEFPPDTFFMESLSQNETFAPGVAFIPVQRWVEQPSKWGKKKKKGEETGEDNNKEGNDEGDTNNNNNKNRNLRLGGKKHVKESHLYEIRPGTTQARHICGPIAAPDGSIAVTIFGSALSSQGMLYLCSFNRNSILRLNLAAVLEGLQETSTDTAKPVQCDMEIEVSSPNDVAIDPSDENLLYVAGGAFQKCCLCCFPFSNSAVGVVYKITLPKEATGDSPPVPDVTVYDDGLSTLAGIEVLPDGELWVAQLFNMFRQRQPYQRSVAWKGDDKDGQVWLADNIDVFHADNQKDSPMLLCPAYSTTSKLATNNVLKNSALSSFFLIMVQLITAGMRGEGIVQALRDPEVSLAFSNTYIKEGEAPKPIRLIFLRPNPKQTETATVYGNRAIAGEGDPEFRVPPAASAIHFEIDLKDTRANHQPWVVYNRRHGKPQGRREFFNEQVTHAAQLQGSDGRSYVVCINFEEPRVLLLDDQVFRNVLEQQEQQQQADLNAAVVH